ncbi:hypothetical protein ATJ97_1437 [Georgenia soli]|uniref:Uncharacterized protein n=1 Tax=Georgenia soli TaxID=638953 RepID=A0A2A9EL15_9MICO|nr:alkaline shock response membrane anchor protein AmaP [Georgenia soli]PFG38945.1 hypothetical protein ATJ97_1437 [Georgenia soli]
MSTGPGRANRVILALLGVLLLAGGVIGLLLSYALLDRPATGPVLPLQVRTFAGQNPWFWWILAVAALLVALLGLRWLLAQARTNRVAALDLTTDPRDGITTVPAGVITDAVEKEATSIAGVEGATARLRSHGGGSRLDLTATLAHRADLAQVRARLEGEVVPHVRQVLGRPDLPVLIELQPEARPARRFR